MKKRKLVLSLSILAAATLGLAACKTDDPNPTPPNPPVEVTTYTVTFENNGHGEAPKEVKEVTKLPTLPTLEEEGWTFGGWYYDSALTKEAKAGEEITANTKLYAKWTKKEAPAPEKYTVRFDSQKGTEVSAKEVEKGKKVAKPEDPTREGYIFKGWYKEAGCTNVWNFDTDVVDKDLTLFAKWEAKPAATYIVEFDSQEGTAVESKTVKEGSLVAKPEDPTREGFVFAGWFKEPNCVTEWKFGENTVNESLTLYAKWSRLYTVSFYMNNYGECLEDITVTALPEELPTPTSIGCNFKGWYLDKDLTIAAEAGKELTENVTLYAKWEIKEGFEEVIYTLSTSDLTVGKSPTDIIVNKYTIGANTEVRSRTRDWYDPITGEKFTFIKSIKLGATSDKLIIDAPGEGKLYIWIQNGSSSAQYQTIILTKPDGTTETIQYEGTIASSPIVRLELDVVKGQYMITRPSGTSDIFKAEMVCALEEAAESGFEIVAPGTIEYIAGQEYDASAIQLNRVYGNGRTEPLPLTDTNITIDASAFSNVAGEYDILVQYKMYEPQIIKVTVYELEGIELGFNATEKIGNTSQNNGVYFNQTVKRIYKLNEEFNPSYLSVKALTAFNGKTKEFLLPETAFVINTSGFDSTVEGEKVIYVSVTSNENTVTESFKVHVVSTEPSMNNDAVQIKVDGNYTGTIGAVVDGFNTFVTIQQALNYLENLGTNYNAKKKLILLSAGTYREKLEVTLPNIELRGAGKEETIIEWNSLYGIPDESGYVQTTDSCSTFNVREKATNMLITGVTISNYWNSLSVFDKDLGPGYAEHRALALLVQADQFVMKDCKLLGYQDTIELFTGRQLIEDTYISGTTDFIFGTNNTTYFKNCEIHSITNGKTDGGYITAFKGSNKGADDYVVYGAIFDGCQFTADADVVANKNTAIGRCWGAYAAVMVMNSTLDGHISTKPFSGSSKNERYVSMNGKPTDATVKFTEYNNTGAGSITASIAGVTVLTDAIAAQLYADYSVIFGTTNGKVSYTNAWDPASTQPVVDTNIYYNFNPSKESLTGTNYNVDTTLSLSGSTQSFGEMTLDATNGNIAYNANSGCVNLKKGALVTFHVEAKTSVTITTYPNYHPYTINGVATVADTFTKYFAEAQDVVIESTGELYLAQIILRLDQEAPQAPVLESISLSNPKTEFMVGEEFSVGELVVNATYSDSSVLTLTSDEYTVSHAVDKDTAGVYEITITVGELSKTYTVTYEGADADPAITVDTTLDFTKDNGYTNSRVNYDAANITRNGDNSAFTGTITFDVKAGAIIYVVPYKTYGNFTIGKSTDENLEVCTAPKKFVVDSDCTIAITGNSGNYIAQIGITYPVSEDVTYSFRTDGEYPNKIVNTFNTVAGFEGIFYIDATAGKFAPRGQQWAQVNQGTKIEFTVAAGASVKINFYDSNYSINGTGATSGTGTIYCEQATTIVLEATGNTYIDSIEITFAV